MESTFSTISTALTELTALAALAGVFWYHRRLVAVEAKIRETIKVMTGLGAACKKVLEAKGITAPEEPVRERKEKKKRYRDRVLGSAY